MDPNLQSVETLAEDITGASAGDDTQQSTPALSTPSDTLGSGTWDFVAVHQEFNEILERLAHLQESFNTKLLYDESKQQQINVLHGDIKQGQERLFQQILRPLYLSLIKLHDLIGDGRKAALKDADGTESIASRNYQTYQGEIEEILMSNGVDTYRTAPGKPFDRSRHQARETLDTSEHSQDNTIAESQRPGFIYAGNVLRPEWVRVYRY